MKMRSQLLKGILEACVLSLIHQKPVYGYELAQKLKESGLPDISDGTIYPILLRLQKNKLIYSEMKPSMSGGPQRKYYYLTETGRQELAEMILEWEQLAGPISTLLMTKGGIQHD